MTPFGPGTGTFFPFRQKSDILQNTALLNGSVKLFKPAENSLKDLGLPCLAVEAQSYLGEGKHSMALPKRREE